MKGRAPGGKVKGGGGKGGNASLPGDSRVSRRATARGCSLDARGYTCKPITVPLATASSLMGKGALSCIECSAQCPPPLHTRHSRFRFVATLRQRTTAPPYSWGLRCSRTSKEKEER
eukprot:scaffold3767_cov114-Isochrysis_galbana.AAC.38